MNVVFVSGTRVIGIEVDAYTGCTHYHSPLDIVAIKYLCCDTYYPCYSCHTEVADHPAQRWKTSQFAEKAILCGKCGFELTIIQYLADTKHEKNECPACGAAFNPGCSKHHAFYFELGPPLA